MASSSFAPVEICITSPRSWCICVALWNPMGTSLLAEWTRKTAILNEKPVCDKNCGAFCWMTIYHIVPASINLSTFASLMPLIFRRSFRLVYATDSTVNKPPSLSFLTSVEDIPDFCAEAGDELRWTWQCGPTNAQHGQREAHLKVLDGEWALGLLKFSSLLNS